MQSSLRCRWTLLSGSSRRRLPELVKQLFRVDLLVHDSMHTTPKVRFASVLGPCSVLEAVALLDDVW